MKIIIVFLFIFAAKTALGQNRVFYNAEDPGTPVISNNIKRIKMPWGRMGANILVEYNDQTKKSIRKKDIWGFQSKDKQIFRFDDGNTLILVDTAAVDIYKTWTRHPTYYYSLDLKSKTILFAKKNLIRSLGPDQFKHVCEVSSLTRRLSQYL